MGVGGWGLERVGGWGGGGVMGWRGGGGVMGWGLTPHFLRCVLRPQAIFHVCLLGPVATLLREMACHGLHFGVERLGLRD